MKLFSRILGEGYPLLVLHGLYGSSDNWITVGKALSEWFEVHLLDLRNHGQSPHSEIHNYPALAADISEYMETRKIAKATILGHSMGGKTAMYFALLNPQMVSNLIVVDISPKTYRFEGDDIPQIMDHKRIIAALCQIDIKNAKSREEIDARLAETIKTERLRLFLLKNVKRRRDGAFEWALNLSALVQNLPGLLLGFDGFDEIQEKKGNTFKALFLRGGDSDYILESDYPMIKERFPYSEIVTIKGAGHWLHAEKPDEVIEKIAQFIF
jgi:esterase